ncbi:MAG: SDR family oxidoreductase [Cyclobacteriaceae bacterium]
MDLDLKGKRALVCGSTQGMGLSIARELANQNARVTLFARNEEVLKQVVQELPGSGHDYLVADFDNLEEVGNAATESLQSGDYQILVNNTGGPTPGKIYEAEIEDFETAMRRHLHVSQTLLKLVLPGMQKAKYGRVVNIISTSVRIPINGLGVSNTVRGAMASWAKTMANELGRFGITVNNILPGFINTGRITSLISSRSKTQARTEAEIKDDMVSSIPAGRFGEPEEIGDYAAFLCSPSGAYINGTSLQIDGGRTGSI